MPHMKGKKHLSVTSVSSSSDKCNVLSFVTNSESKPTTPTEQSSPVPTFATHSAPWTHTCQIEVCLNKVEA